MFRTLSSLALSSIAMAALVFAACGQTGQTTCNADSCDGCCDSTGRCRTGDQNDACGSGGLHCDVCSGGQMCVQRVCTVPMNDAGSGGGTGGGGGDMDAGTGGGRGLCTATPVECSDAAINALDLKVAVSPDGITNTADGAGWLSTIDSRAGGLTPTQSFVYARFGANGLEKVALGDQAALDSMDWDIAFRRFVIRLNGGDSGPSCTVAAKLPEGTTYDSVTAVPEGLTWAPDNFLDRPPTCNFIDDGSGLPTSPSTALSSYYEYTTCVSMTGRVFVVQTKDNRHVKLVVTTYYATPSQQNACDTNGTGGMGGWIRMRWQFLD